MCGVAKPMNSENAVNDSIEVRSDVARPGGSLSCWVNSAASSAPTTPKMAPEAPTDTPARAAKNRLASDPNSPATR